MNLHQEQAHWDGEAASLKVRRLRPFHPSAHPEPAEGLRVRHYRLPSIAESPVTLPRSEWLAAPLGVIALFAAVLALATVLP